MTSVVAGSITCTVNKFFHLDTLFGDKSYGPERVRRKSSYRPSEFIPLLQWVACRRTASQSAIAGLFCEPACGTMRFFASIGDSASIKAGGRLAAMSDRSPADNMSGTITCPGRY